MITYISGDILKDDAEALVCPVNTQGVIRPGLARQFKEAFPNVENVYKNLCRKKFLKIGKVISHWEWNPSIKFYQAIVYFPTKEHWTDSYRLEWISEGLTSLVDAIEHEGIGSVAIPAIGCDLGGLSWDQVKNEIETAFSKLPNLKVRLYLPEYLPLSDKDEIL